MSLSLFVILSFCQLAGLLKRLCIKFSEILKGIGLQ